LKSLRKKLAVPGALALSACSAPMPTMDAGSDAGSDAGRDAGVDAGYDAGFDAGYDAGVPDAGSDAGYDAGMNDGGDLGPCPNSSPGTPVPGSSVTLASGVRCECESFFYADGGPGECCDTDIGNPCPICCFNPMDADGGREYSLPDGGTAYGYTDAGFPVCYC
jgi:hypothetical protein